MPDFQYLFVVLASNPNEYVYLKQLDCVEPPFDELVDAGVPNLYYRVILPPTDERIGLPSHPFSWTSIAYILWDGLAPERLTPAQSQAMLDWLHWGGQLIVSGPDSLGSLQNSFLGPYLPATFVRSRQLDDADLAEMNRQWSMKPAKGNQPQSLDVSAGSPLLGIQFNAAPEAEFLPGTGQQVIERRVGRGRIVLTSFSLSDRPIVNWGSYDAFFNACLFRRPRREFKLVEYGSVQTLWADFRGDELDPRFSTATRYFSRDIGPLGASDQRHEADGNPYFGGYLGASDSGMGGWNDMSGAATEARNSLRAASGISIPNARFVITVLAAYLLILVPVNWGIFRLLGRVEWAWVAAPIIAIVGAGLVVHLAQLDIGFARSQTEISILEGQGGYARGHLTRYLALYTSLASKYEVQFDDPNAVAQPFPGQSKLTRPVPITLRRTAETRLSGFLVDSVLTEFLHCEQQLDVGGTFELIGDDPNQWQIRNGTDLALARLAVVTRTTDGAIRSAWISGLPSGASAQLRWDSSLDAESLAVRLAKGNAATPGEGPSLDIRGLYALALQVLELRPGDVRLVGTLADSPPGMTITPTASQMLSRHMVIWHLRYGPLPTPVPDVNMPGDVRDFNLPEVDPSAAMPNGV